MKKIIIVILLTIPYLILSMFKDKPKPYLTMRRTKI